MNDMPRIDAFGALTEPTTLTIQRVLPGPIERVWAYLTESDKRRQWLAAGALFVAVGADTMLLASAAQELLARFRTNDGAAPLRPAGY